MVRATEARDASAISSLGKLLARLEPSGEQRVRPSLLYPHLVNCTTLSPLAHRPVGPCSLGPQPSRPAPAISFFFLLHPFQLRCPRTLRLSAMAFSPSLNPFLSLYLVRWKFRSNIHFSQFSSYLYVTRGIVGKNWKHLSTLESISIFLKQGEYFVWEVIGIRRR